MIPEFLIARTAVDEGRIGRGDGDTERVICEAKDKKMATVLRQMIDVLDRAIELVDSTCTYLEAFHKNLDANTQTTRETDELEACADKILQNGKDFMDVYLQASGLHRSLSNKNAPLGGQEANHVHFIFQTIASYLLLFNVSAKDIYAHTLTVEMMDSRPLRSVKNMALKCL